MQAYIHTCVMYDTHSYTHISTIYEKLKSHPSIYPSVCIFGTQITQQYLHRLKQHLFEMKLFLRGLQNLFYKPTYRTHHLLTGVHKR